MNSMYKVLHDKYKSTQSRLILNGGRDSEGTEKQAGGHSEVITFVRIANKASPASSLPSSLPPPAIVLVLSRLNASEALAIFIFLSGFSRRTCITQTWEWERRQRSLFSHGRTVVRI